MTNRFFTEKDGKVAHSPSSRLLVENLLLAAFVDLHTTTALKSIAHALDAVERWPDSQNPREGGLSLALGRPAETSMYEEVMKDPAKTVSFTRAMQFFDTVEGYEVDSLVKGYPWGNLPKGGVVVDVSPHGVYKVVDCVID
jgi:hypothetical protein